MWKKDGYYGVMSFNLRCDIGGYMSITYGDKDREHSRGHRALKLIDKYSPDVIGFQEGTNPWMRFLSVELHKKNYEYEGIGRERGLSDFSQDFWEEYAPVFYKIDKFEKLEGGTFWLSETPDKLSGAAWDAANTRICTYAVLKDKSNNNTTIFFNTHVDHIGAVARQKGIDVIISKMNELTKKYKNAGIIGTGDYNETEKGVEADFVPMVYNLMTTHFDDAKKIAATVVKNRNTFNGYGTDWDKRDIENEYKGNLESYPIDYIYLGKNMYNANIYTVCDDTYDFIYEDKQYTNHPVSDHYPIFALVKKV